MREVLPGIWDWSAPHPKLGFEVHGHYLADSGTVIDPMTPEEGLAFFEERGVERVVLSNRHHDRDALAFARAFGCPVLCHEDGLHEFEDRELEAEGFAFGDEPAPGLRAHQVLPGWPDETALHLPGEGVLVIADAVVRDEEEALAFVPDRYLGDDPEHERVELRAGLRRLLDLEFDHLLLAHGPPWIGGAKRALQEFVGA